MNTKTMEKQKIKCIRCKRVIHTTKKDVPRISTEPYCDKCYSIKKCERKAKSKHL